MAFNNLLTRFFMADPAGGSASPGDVQNQAALNKELTATEELALEIKNAFRGISAEIETIISDKLKRSKGEFKSIGLSIKKDIVGSLKEQSKESQRLLALQDKQINGSLKVADVEERLKKTKEKQRDIALAIEEAVREGIISQETANDKLRQATEQYNLQKKALDEMNRKAEIFEKKLGITYKIFDGINKIPILNSLIHIDKVKSKMEEAAAAGKSTWGTFGTGIKETFKQIGKSLMDPLTIVTSIFGIFKFLLDVALELDKHITDFSKGLGISKEAAHQLENNFENASLNAEQYSKNLTAGTFSIKAQMEATNQLNESLGTAELFTEKMLAGQVLLTKRLGLSNEEASEFAKFSLLSGKSQEDITAEIGDQIIAFRKETGVQLNLKKVMQDVTKVHGQLSANLGNDPKKIAEAVMHAKKLGLEIEQTKKMSDSLLNFESSIQDELEAELLTGKSLNLEKARALALQGKTTEAAAELMSQVGGLSEFQKLNVLQQDALAKTVGLTANEMADAFKQQELLKGTAFQTKDAFLEQYRLAEQNGTLAEFQAEVKRAANGEELLAMGAKQSAQDKFNETIEKLKESLNKIVGGPLLGMVDRFADFISKGENIKKIVDWVKGAFTTIKVIIAAIGTVHLTKMIYGLTTALVLARQKAAVAKQEAIIDAADASAEVAKSAASAPLVGAVVAGIAATAIFGTLMSLINSATSVEDAAISSTGGLMISGPKGSFITHPEDEIIAAPGASKMLEGNSGISKADLEAISNRPVMVSVNANTDTLLRLQTAQTQYGSSRLFA